MHPFLTAIDGFGTTVSGRDATLINAVVSCYAPHVTQYLKSSATVLLPDACGGADVCQQ
ncbi:MAG TPA: hypothetical protein VLB69_08025 [Rudaea sp.]|nr:hypothetical protein [Rudaea sp.]